MPKIHSTAVVESGAAIADDAVIGAFAVVGPAVTIGPGCVIDHHASITGNTTLGARNRVFPFASLGTPPQDLKYAGEETRLVIGDGNTFREFVTCNCGTAGGGGVTRIGNRNFLMAYAHVAHDCSIGDGVVMANCATLAGHVHIGDHAIIGGLTAVHQFVRIGKNTMVGGASAVTMDIAPFMTASGNRASLYGLNLVGLKRHNFSKEALDGLKKVYRIVFRSGLTLEEALATAQRDVKSCPEVDHLLDFLKSSTRGITR